MASEIKSNKISPAAGTDFTFGDSGDTFTIPSGGTIDVNGTLDVTGATVSGLTTGKVLQFQNKQGYTGLIQVDNVTSYASAGSTWNISLTPEESSSKVIISIGSNYVNYGAGTQYTGRCKVYRQINGGGYVDIDAQASTVPIVNAGYGSTSNALTPFSMFYVDSSHNTTLPVDYQIYVSTSNNTTIQFADGTGSYRFINAMEVAS